MSLRILNAGLQTTVQDLGRPGWGSSGVSPGGAADPVSCRLANALVGNEAGAAALEMTLLGDTIQCERAAVVALCGGEVYATLESSMGARPIPMYQAVRLAAGDRLVVGPVRRGARVYLAVQGGIEVPPVLCSRSTSVMGAFGGVEGRALRTGDCVAVGSAIGGTPRVASALLPSVMERIIQPGVLRVLWSDQVSSGVREALQGAELVVSARSSRAGVRLSGGPAQLGTGGLPSDPMALGAIQLPPGGELIVMGVERPVTGGYAVIGCVAAVDHATIGQLRPGTRIHCETVTRDAARQLWQEQQHTLATSLIPGEDA